MPIIYNPNDVVVIQRNEISSSFVERVLTSQPNSYILFNSASRMSTVSTGSLFAPGATLDVTASWAVNAINGGTQLVTGSNYPITVSWSNVTQELLNSNASIGLNGNAIFQDITGTSLTIEGGGTDFSVKNGIVTISASTDLEVNGTASFYGPTTFYGNLEATASNALRSISSSISDKATSIEIAEAIDTYVPTWQSNQLTTASALRIIDGKYININSASYDDPANTPTIHSIQVDPDNFNAALFEGTIHENYVQVTIRNTGTGSGASADLVADNDQFGSDKYIDVGINSSQYSQSGYSIQGPNDSYVFNEGGHLSIGTKTAGKVLKLHAGSTNAENEIARVTETGMYLTGSIQLSLGGTIVANTSSAAKDFKPGQMWWDEANHTYTIDTDKTDVRLQIGQESYIRVEAGVNISNGQVVYLSGSNLAGYPYAYLALADSTGIKSSIVGLATQNLTAGESGFVTTAGIVNDLNTTAIGAAPGSLVYLSSTTPGGMVSSPPMAPYEVVIVGEVLFVDPSTGRVLVDITQNTRQFAFVGMTDIPSVSSTGSTTGSVVNVGSAGVFLCETPDGKGLIKYFTVPSASFTISSSFLDVQYLVANYDSGIPYYSIETNLNSIDDIQTTPVGTFTIGTNGALSYTDWDDPGLLLANKQNHRIIDLYGAQRASGLEIAASASHITLDAGTGYLGVKQLTFTTASTRNPGQFVLLAHSASVWSGSFINGWINDRYDDGTNLQPLGGNKYVVNYVWRGIGSQNRAQVTLGQEYTNYADVVESIMPAPPAELGNIAILTGRIITRQGVATAQLVESAFTTIFSVAGITDHNNLNGLLGGTYPEYYHLTSAEYTTLQSGTSSFAKTASVAIRAITASNANTASILAPGSMLWVVSGSNGVAPAFLAPYDYSIDNVYRPTPIREGWTHWDHKWNNWAVFDDSGARTHLGKEVVMAVHNPTATTYPRMAPVYISGSSPSTNPTWSVTYKPDVYLAQADGTGTKDNVVGLIRQAIPSGSSGYMLVVGTMHNSDVTPFGDVGTEIWLDSATSGGITTTKPGQPYEAVSLGYVIEAGTVGSLLVNVNKEEPPVAAYAGMTSTPIIYNLNDGTIGISTGSVNLFHDPTGFGEVDGHPLNVVTMSLITGSTNYIVAEHSGSSETIAKYTLTTDESYANGIDIVRVATLDVYTGDPPGTQWDVHQFNVGIVGLALANKLNNKDIRLYGYQRENGLTLYTTGSSGSFGITEGNIWYGPNSTIVPTFDTTLPGYYTYIFHRSGSAWHQHTSSVFLTGVYDNGSGSAEQLAVCAPNSWSVNYIYRLIGTSDEAAIVMSSDQFATSLEASNNATTPPNLPSTIVDIGLLVGRFIVQSGSYNPTIESAFSNTFVPAVVTNHESLLGLQGGQGGEHYHMTFEDYTGTGTGLMMRQNNPTASNIMHAPATPFHVPYWSVNKTLTYTGSVQVYQGQYVLINSGSPTTGNEEALLVKQVNNISVNTIGAYSEVNDYSQIYNQNFSSGSSASTDIVATSDNGDQSSSYVDVGIASSQYNDPRWPWLQPNGAYLENDGGDLWIATLSDTQLKFVFNNTASTNYADKTGFYLSGSFFGTSSWAEKAISASWAPDQGATTLYTGSTYQITTSWANNTNATRLYTASTYPITSSWSVSSSWSPNQGATTLFTGSTYEITSSWSNNSLMSNATISASYASSSVTASYLPVGTYNITASWAKTASMVSGSGTSTVGQLITSFPAVGGVQVQAGRNLPFYLHSNWPTLGFNAYYDGGWKYGEGSSGNYGAFQTFDVRAGFNGEMGYWFPTTTGSAGGTMSTARQVFSFYADGRIRAPISFTDPALVAADTNGYFYPIPITGSVYPITSSWAVNSTSASWSPNQGATTLYTASTYQITSSWSVSSSWSPNQGATTLYTGSTYDITASWASNTNATTLYTSSTYQITSSWAVSASWSPNQGATTLYTGSTYDITASWAVNAINGGTQLVTASTYPITSSWAESATSASWAPAAAPVTSVPSASWASSSLSASVAQTASFALGVPTIKAGLFSGSAMTGNPKTLAITFTTPFVSNLYSIAVTGEASRTWTIQTKTPSGFTVNSNNNTTPVGMVFWQSIYQGEYYS